MADRVQIQPRDARTGRTVGRILRDLCHDRAEPRQDPLRRHLSQGKHPGRRGDELRAEGLKVQRAHDAGIHPPRAKAQRHGQG